MISDERPLTAQQVAVMLGVDEQTVRRWIKAGRLQAFKPGRAYKIPRESLAAFLERSTPLAVAAPDPSGSGAERRAAGEFEAHTELVLAASRVGYEMAEREDLYAELAEAVAERLGGVFEDGFEHYHASRSGGVPDDVLGRLAEALMELVASIDALTGAAVRLERDPAKQSRLIDFAAHQRRERPEIPRSAAG